MNSDGSVYRFDPNNPPQISPSVIASSTAGGSTREKETTVEKEATGMDLSLVNITVGKRKQCMERIVKNICRDTYVYVYEIHCLRIY